jgi:hypothetical protein
MTFSRINRISLFIVILSLIAVQSNAQITKTVGLLKGSVTLADGTPLANIPVTILKGNDVLNTTKSSPDGKITSILQPGATYRIRVNTSGYLYYEDTLSLGALKSYQEFPVHITLSPLADGQAFSLPLPVFAPKSQSILSCAQPEFDRIIEQMKHNPKLSASITVYPDMPVKTKKDAAQKTLAASREMSIRSYFLGKGISESHFSVASEIASVPPGKFQPNDPVFPPSTATTAPSKKKKKKTKASEPTAPSLVPQYIEVVAHMAS